MESLVTLLGQSSSNGGAAGGIVAGIVLLVELVIIVIMIIGLWKVFEKAGQPGWGAIIPIYNIILLLKIAGRPIWWIILMLIPIVNLVVSIIMTIDIAKNFGRSVLFGVGLLFLPFIFYPVLGFGSAEYSPQ